MKIDALTLYTAHLEPLMHFYASVIGLPTKEGSDWFSVHTPETNLGFAYDPAIENPTYHFAFNIPSNKIDQAAAFITERVDLIWLNDYNDFIADFVNWNAKSFYFLDPAGNIVEFIARRELGVHVSEAFHPGHILSVSEVGLVFPVETFDERVSALLIEHQLSYFDKQPPLPQFRAVGDDKGLFICVPAKRAWYPTEDTESGLYPLEVRFETNGKTYTRRF